MNRTGLLITCLFAFSCTSEKAPSNEAYVVAEFYGGVQDGTMTVNMISQSTSGLLPANVVQDGVTGSGPLESIELETTNLAIGPPTCPTLDSFCGDITIRSFYSVELSNVWVEIYSMVPATGYEAINGDQDTSGGNLDEIYGLWDYGDIASSGGTSTKQWVFLYASGGNFSFAGRVMAAGHGLEVKQGASGAAAGDSFGQSVSVNGDLAVVGAPYDDHQGFQTGSAHVFSRNQGGSDAWGQIAPLTASDAAAGDSFGQSVSVSGDVAVVAAHGDDDAGFNAGSSYVFLRDQGGSGAWGEAAKLTALDAAANDWFGSSVSVSSTVIVVGTVNDDDMGSASGSAYVFYRNQGGTNAWGQVAKLTASDGAAQDYFGYSVSISGDVAVIGAWGDDSLSGSAYIFYRNQGGTDAWGQVAKLTASDAGAQDKFGFSVSIDGDIVVVGAYHDDDSGTDSGSAYVFYRNQGGPDAWGQVAKLTASDGAAQDLFGRSVSISGNSAVIGAFQDDDAGSDSGSAYIFSRNKGGSDAWGQVDKLTAEDAAANDYYGFSVCMEGNHVIVGAPGNDDAGSSSGSVYFE